MLIKLLFEFFYLNGPVFVLLFFSTIYTIVALKLKSVTKPKGSKSPIIGEELDKLLFDLNLIEKLNTIFNYFLIGIHLILLVSLLFTSNIFSFGSTSTSINVNKLITNLNLPDNYDALINNKKQVDLLKNFCTTNHLNSICEVNNQINDLINEKLKNIQLSRKGTSLKSQLDDKINLNESGRCKGKTFYSKDYLSNRELDQDLKPDDDKNDKNILDQEDDLFNRFYLSALDQILSAQIRTTFLGFITIFISLVHYFDTFMSCLFELKINNKQKVNHLESNYTHLLERILTPFYIYFDFRAFNSPTYLWFSISWCLLHITQRLTYVKEIRNEKAFKPKQLLNSLMQKKLIFYGVRLLLASYLITSNDLNSLNQVSRPIRLFNLAFGLILFLSSLVDLEEIAKLKDQEVSLDQNNNISSIQPRKLSFNISNSTHINHNNYYNNNHIKHTNSFHQPVCTNLNRRF